MAMMEKPRTKSSSRSKPRIPDIEQGMPDSRDFDMMRRYHGGNNPSGVANPGGMFGSQTMVLVDQPRRPNPAPLMFHEPQPPPVEKSHKIMAILYAVFVFVACFWCWPFATCAYLFAAKGTKSKSNRKAQDHLRASMITSTIGLVLGGLTWILLILFIILRDMDYRYTDVGYNLVHSGRE